MFAYDTCGFVYNILLSLASEPVLGSSVFGGVFALTLSSTYFRGKTNSNKMETDMAIIMAC